MAEQKEIYRVINPASLEDLANQVNRILAMQADRADSQEGRRGMPVFYSNLDLGGHRGTNASDALQDADLLTKSGTSAATIKLLTARNIAGTPFDGTEDIDIHHGALIGLSDDDHPQYIRHSLATAANDFLVASGPGVFVKKTLAEVQALVGLGGYVPSTRTLTINGLAQDLSTDRTWTLILPATEAGAANNFLTAYDSTTGAFTKAQPTQANISGLTTASTPTFAGVKLGSASSVICLTTSDASDNGRLQLSGGGATGSTRGGYINICGNEYATYSGTISLIAGTVAGAYVNFLTGPTAERFRIDYDGNLTVFQTSSAPSTPAANTAFLYANDINGAAGYTGLHMITETTNAREVVVGCLIKGTTGDPSNPHETMMCLNTYDNTLKIYADAAWRTLASGW